MIPQTAPSKAAPTGATIERWEIDRMRSSLRFTVRHIVIQQIEGSFRRWGGTLFIDRADPSLSNAQVWIDLASIETGDPERDAHVRSPEFLDVARFPRAEFCSTDVRFDEEQMIVEGRLDLHGIIHDVELRASIGPSRTGPDGCERSRCTANGTLDRQSFDLHWNQDLDVGGIVVGDTVAITADVELVRSEVRGSPLSQ